MTTEDWHRIFQTKIGELHRRDHWLIEFDDSIVADSPASGWEQYIRSANANFRCSKCKKGWPSNRVMVVFHMRLEPQTSQGMVLEPQTNQWMVLEPQAGQGTVKVRRFRQKCRRCQDAPMEEASFAADNIDVLLEKLTEKIRIKCYHEDLGQRNRPFRTAEVEGPHEAAHCEACMNGICARQNVSTMY